MVAFSKLFEEREDEYVLIADNTNPYYQFYNKQEQSIWFTQSINFRGDKDAFDKLKKKEQDLILSVLSFFASVDGIVNENIAVTFKSVIKDPYVKAFYTVQQFVETIHQKTYSQQIVALEPDKEKRNKIFFALNSNEGVKRKAQWAKKWIKEVDVTTEEGVKHFVQALIAFAIIEGVFLTGAFAVIFLLRFKKIDIEGLIESNDYISKDEYLHVYFAATMFNLEFLGKMNTDFIIPMLEEAVEIESMYIQENFHSDLLDKNQMITYVKFMADDLLVNLSLPKHYNVKNPFPWMYTIQISHKANFFEKKETAYHLANKKHEESEQDEKEVDF